MKTAFKRIDGDDKRPVQHLRVDRAARRGRGTSSTSALPGGLHRPRGNLRLRSIGRAPLDGPWRDDRHPARRSPRLRNAPRPSRAGSSPISTRRRISEAGVAGTLRSERRHGLPREAAPPSTCVQSPARHGLEFPVAVRKTLGLAGSASSHGGSLSPRLNSHLPGLAPATAGRAFPCRNVRVMWARAARGGGPVVLEALAAISASSSGPRPRSR